MQYGAYRENIYADFLERTPKKGDQNSPALRRSAIPRKTPLKLPTLNYRRKRGDMTRCYKIFHGLVDSPGNLLKLAKLGQRSLRGTV